ncbi:MAG: DUF1552 domain-containing protein, partial [Planctomycetaceae bacterium]
MIQRRQFLQGLGACIALPAMQSLNAKSVMASGLPETGLATTATGAPLRTAFLYFPNGAIPSAWWPEGEEREFKLGRTLEPLTSKIDQVQILHGLDNKPAEAGRDGGGDHARGNGTFLTGVRLNKSATDIRNGISIDQEIASRIGHLTRFASLELSCEAHRPTGNCDSGYSCAYQFNLSWKNATTPMSPEANPRLVFERLFGAGSVGERAANLQRRRHEQRSILDFVMDDARAMQSRLAKTDGAKLDQYLTGVREIEARIQKAETFGNPADPNVNTPPGIPPSYAEHLALMYDMLILAFQTDSTRVATMLLAHDGSNRSFEHIGVVEGHHDLSHHQEKQDRIDKVAQIDRWYIEQFAAFLERLDAVVDVDGKSLLHNSMILLGSGNADGNRHSHTDVPVILAGHGGGQLATRRFVKHGSKPLTNLFLGLTDKLGIQDLNR